MGEKQINHRTLDLYAILAALGERALDSIWQGSGVDCFGAKAEELCALTDQAQPIAGHDLLHLTSGIYQTIEGDFKAFDQDATSHWLFIRAWDGSGFYVETNDPEIKERLKTGFQDVEEINEARHPYQGLFIPVPDPAPRIPAPPVQPSKPPGRRKTSWDPSVFAEHNRKSTSLVSAFFLIDSLEAISKCIQWLALLKPYNLPDMEHSQYFNEVREIYESNREVINFDREFKVYWENKELQAFLRCHFFDKGRYEIELLLPGVIANEVADKFKDGREGFLYGFMPPQFYD